MLGRPRTTEIGAGPARLLSRWETHGRSSDAALLGTPARAARKDTMAWDFSTEPEFQAKLDWAREFVAERVEPLDLCYPHRQFHPLDAELRPIVDP